MKILSKPTAEQKRGYVERSLNTKYMTIEKARNVVDIPYFLKAQAELRTIEQTGSLNRAYKAFKRQGGCNV